MSYLCGRATTDGILEVCRVFRLFHDTRHRPALRLVALRLLPHLHPHLHPRLPGRLHRPDC